jgi:hypothetical protein
MTNPSKAEPTANAEHAIPSTAVLRRSLIAQSVSADKNVMHANTIDMSIGK